MSDSNTSYADIAAKNAHQDPAEKSAKPVSVPEKTTSSSPTTKIVSESEVQDQTSLSSSSGQGSGPTASSNIDLLDTSEFPAPKDALPQLNSNDNKDGNDTKKNGKRIYDDVVKNVKSAAATAYGKVVSEGQLENPVVAANVGLVSVVIGGWVALATNVFGTSNHVSSLYNSSHGKIAVAVAGASTVAFIAADVYWSLTNYAKFDKKRT
ncbi:hypothetical protein V1514DRAFT_337258 [Lipomyces japonicus]|uniref:uncharacterized protein n=1 Tax=Lipomyces japonicus TaxID=56871 RepID=UPI0034CDC230